jgi:hypothetical protein
VGRQFVAACAAGLALCANSAMAAPVLDQQVELAAGANFTNANFGALYRAQTFTVGISGKLSRFEVQWRVDNVTSMTREFEIWNTTSGGAPVTITVPSAPLASATLSYTGPGFETVWVGADLASGIPVTAGDVLAIVAVSGGVIDAYWVGPAGLGSDPYTRGQSFSTSIFAPLAWGTLGPTDLGFRTYVEPSGESLLADLLTSVTGKGSGKSLANKVKLAQTYFAADDIPATCAVLSDFLNEVKAQRAKKKLTAAQADDFTEQAMVLMTAIGCDG